MHMDRRLPLCGCHLGGAQAPGRSPCPARSQSPRSVEMSLLQPAGVLPGKQENTHTQKKSFLGEGRRAGLSKSEAAQPPGKERAGESVRGLQPRPCPPPCHQRARRPGGLPRQRPTPTRLSDLSSLLVPCTRCPGPRKGQPTQAAVLTGGGGAARLGRRLAPTRLAWPVGTRTPPGPEPPPAALSPVRDLGMLDSPQQGFC